MNKAFSFCLPVLQNISQLLTSQNLPQGASIIHSQETYLTNHNAKTKVKEIFTSVSQIVDLMTATGYIKYMLT
jgi:hypothetical protein